MRQNLALGSARTVHAPPHSAWAPHVTPLHSLPVPEPGTAPLWLALDEVTDPQNFGALLRSAHFLGADGVLVI